MDEALRIWFYGFLLSNLFRLSGGPGEWSGLRTPDWNYYGYGCAVGVCVSECVCADLQHSNPSGIIAGQDQDQDQDRDRDHQALIKVAVEVNWRWHPPGGSVILPGQLPPASLLLPPAIDDDVATAGRVPEAQLLTLFGGQCQCHWSL